jgi:hypothetical protein
MMQRRKTKTNTELVQATLDNRQVRLDIDAQLDQHIRGTAATGRSAIPVFGDHGTGSGRDQGRGCADVERAQSTSARPACIDNPRPAGPNRMHVFPQTQRRANKLFDCLAALMESHKEFGNVVSIRQAGHQQVRHALHLFARQFLPGPDNANEFSNGCRHESSWKLGGLGGDLPAIV